MPDPILQTRLHTVVKRSMIHGPYAVEKESDPCLRDGRCSKRYPKAFSLAITNAEDGYPVYRSRDNGRFSLTSSVKSDSIVLTCYELIDSTCDIY